MDPSWALRGVALGLLIAAPVGPIGVLCIRRTLALGRAHGFISGVGAATADAVYGGVAGFGLTYVAEALVGLQTWLRLLGGVFLLWLGGRTLLAPPADAAEGGAGRGLLGAYASTFLLTLANPATILSFVGVFAGLGLGAEAGGDRGAASALVAGVFVGSALWWLLLSGAAGALRGRLDARGLRLVNLVSGALIVVFGLAALAGALP